MCSGLNHKRISDIREAELKQKLIDAMANDRSHVRELSKNE